MSGRGVDRALAGRAAALALVAVSPGCAGAPPRDAAAIARTTEEEIEHDGWTRTYRVHLPAGHDRSRPAPLVIVLHGGGGSGLGVEEVTGFSGIADRERFIAVYPDGIGGPHGIGRAWNAGDCCGRPHLFGVSDVGFIRRLAVELPPRLGADPRRVFVVGWSNGALLAYRIGSELSDVVAGIAAYAGTMRGDGPLAAPRFELAPPRRPIAVLAAQGTEDAYAALAGRDDGDGVEVSFAHAGRFWAVAAGCRGRPSRSLERGGAVWIDAYPGCPPSAPVAQVILRGWHHEWPGPASTGGLSAGAPLRGYDLAEVIWAFFARVEPR